MNFENVTDNDEKYRWLYDTLPLLARPELGFPLTVQNELTKHLKKLEDGVRDVLKAQRRRLVTDAFFAAVVQRGRVTKEYPKDRAIDRLIAKIDKTYEGVFSGKSPWRAIEEASPGKAKASRPSKASLIMDRLAIADRLYAERLAAPIRAPSAFYRPGLFANQSSY